jgi:tetratricopeptide (TPR) repeat protein
MMTECEELRIRVWKIGTGRYFILANGPKTASAVTTLKKPPEFYLNGLNELLKEEFKRVPPSKTPVRQRLQELGRELFEFFFPKSIYDCLDGSLGFAVNQYQQRKLRLRFHLDPELVSLPLEILCAPANNPLGFLALHPNISLVRSLPGCPPNQLRLPRPKDLPETLTVLVIWASPRDRDQIDVQGEVKKLRERLQDLIDLKFVSLEEIEHATRDKLTNTLGRVRGPCAVLIISHGEYDKETMQGYVILEDANGSSDQVASDILANLLLNASGLRFVVLNLCKGGQTSPYDPFSGVAQRLIASGIPIVVALQSEVSDEAAIEFSPALFNCISQNQIVDVACASARDMMASMKQGTTIEWCTPVLFFHEACSYAWLFKVPEITRKTASPDPLKEAENILRSGSLSLEDLVVVIRYLKTQGNWKRALSFAQAGLKVDANDAVLRSMWVEAYVEFNLIELCREICEELAREGDCDCQKARQTMEELEKLGNQLDPSAAGEVLRDLREEINKASELQNKYNQALRKEKRENWQEVIRIYSQILEERPAGYRDVIERLERAKTEKQLLQWYNKAKKAEDKRNWKEAVQLYEGILKVRCAGCRDTEHRLKQAKEELTLQTAYSEAIDLERAGNFQEALKKYEQILEIRPGYEDASERYSYCRGRVAEEEDRWADAREAYRLVTMHLYPDASDRLKYAQGRAAEQKNEWSDAVVAYESLPEDYKDRQMRLLYANGRAAEQEEKWSEAVAAYEQIPIPDWEDVPKRLPYAQGRAAEQEEKWEEAEAAYKKLERDYEDVSERLPYCCGRAAEEREDWQGVIDGFGSLLDTYRDVGPRRYYARGRKAEAEGKWDEAIKEGFAKLPDDYRDGDVGKRLCYATGRLAAEQGDWERVIRGFGELPDDYYPLPIFQDNKVGDWRRYARGRIAEAEEKWEEATEAYKDLPEDFEDTKERCAYARGRMAEQHENWEEVIAAFQVLPDTYRDGDVGKRKAYATGRIAVQKGQWAEAEKAFESLHDFQDALQFFHYAKGRLAGDANDWTTALDTFKKLPKGWRDEEVYNWCSYAQGRVYEQLGEWRAALKAYQPLHDGFQDITQRRERLTQLLRVAPWIDGLTRAHLVRDPACYEDGVFPYDVLSPAGITADSPQRDVKDASFTLMEEGLMTPEGRLAWDQLRSVPERLKVDALMYRLRGVKDLRSLQQRLEPLPKSELVRQVCNEVPEDAPLMLLLSGRREEAISAWEEQQRQKPGDMSVAHSLAIAYLYWAKELETGGAYEKAEVAWEHAIANWAFLLADDAYWLSWRRDREACYKEVVSEGDISKLRSELNGHIAKELAQYANRYEAEGRKERATKYQQLALTFEVELEGVRALKEVGGLLWQEGGDLHLCCGLVLLRNLQLEQALAKFILDLERGLEREVEEPVDVIAALEAVLERAEGQRQPTVTPEILLRLRYAFSELGKPFVLLERRRYEEALQALPAEYYRLKISQLPPDCDLSQHIEPGHIERCERCQMFMRSNPAYLCLPHRGARLSRDAVELAVGIHLAIAEDAITSGEGDLNEVLRHWEQAINISCNAGKQVRTKQAIAQVALGRAHALEQERGPQRGQRLTEAINLLEAVRGLIGGVDEAQLKGKQSELLADRGVWYGYGCHQWQDPDYEKAANDLRWALELNPNSLHTRDNLARALVFHAVNLHHNGLHRRPMQLFNEALSVLDEGLRRFANPPQLQATLRTALEELEEVLLSDQSREEALRRLDEVLRSPGPSSGAAKPSVQELISLAKEKLEANDVSGAILDLIKAVRIDPTDEPARGELLLAMQRQVGSKIEEG